jgi:hypothetical protein
MRGENLDPLLQKPLSKACIRSCRSEKTVLNFFANLFKIGSDTPLYYIQIINFTIYLIINPLTPLSLTAMPFRGDGGRRYSETDFLQCRHSCYCFDRNSCKSCTVIEIDIIEGIFCIVITTSVNIVVFHEKHNWDTGI